LKSVADLREMLNQVDRINFLIKTYYLGVNEEVVLVKLAKSPTCSATTGLLIHLTWGGCRFDGFTRRERMNLWRSRTEHVRSDGKRRG
jgi:hypothetical protein